MNFGVALTASRTSADRLVAGELLGDPISIEIRGKFGRERLGQSFDERRSQIDPFRAAGTPKSVGREFSVWPAAVGHRKVAKGYTQEQ